MVSPLFRRKGKPDHTFPSQLQSGFSSCSIPGSKYEWGTHALNVFNAENLKSVIWASVAPLVASSVVFFSIPQQSYADVPNYIQKSVPTAVLITGPTVRQFSIPQQFDISLNGSIVWTQGTLSPNIDISAPPQAGGKGGKRRRILPDGRHIYATDFEMSQILLNYRRQKSIELKTEIKPTEIKSVRVKPSSPIVLPEVLFEDKKRLQQLEEEILVLLIHESTRRSH